MRSGLVICNLPCYNSLENPIGIETYDVEPASEVRVSYNSLENPIGIET